MNYPDDLDIAQLKAPPASLEAEQSVIGGLLISVGNLDAVAEILTDSDFYYPAHRFLYRRFVELDIAGKPIDVTIVADSMTPQEMAGIGGFIYLAEMARSTPSTSNIRAYAKAVKERANLRALIAAGQAIADNAFNAGQQTSTELIDEAQRMVLAIGEQTADEADLHVSASFRDYIAELTRRSESDGLAGLSTGFKDLDRRTNGLMGGDLIIIAGRPSCGKTAVAMNIAENAAVSNGKCVLVFSMEMSRVQLIDRMVASVGKIPYALLRSGKVFGSEYDHVITPTASRIKNAKIYIDERGGLTVQQMRTSARRLHKKTPIDLIIVDYLQLARAKAENRTTEITAVSQALKALAKELNVPLIALSQLSRKCEEQKRRPISSDLRDSGSIEQDADAIFLMYRDEMYNEDSKEKGMAEIICAKLRNGEPGSDWLQSNLAMCKFQDLLLPFQRPVVDNVEPIRKRRGFDV